MSEPLTRADFLAAVHSIFVYDAGQRAEIKRLEVQVKELKKSHCKDCCCGQSWEALEITAYTGRSIPEHIRVLKQQLADAQAEIAKLKGAVTVDEDSHY